MTTRLQELWDSRAPREKLLVAAAFAIVVAVLYLWLLQSAAEARARLKQSVAALRVQIVQLDQQSVEYTKLRAAPAAAASAGDLRTLVQSHSDAAGLGRTLLKIDVQDTHRVQVAFGAVAFAEWLDWAQSLQAQHVRIETSRIEALSGAGLVSVTATLSRTPSP